MVACKRGLGSGPLSFFLNIACFAFIWVPARNRARLLFRRVESTRKEPGFNFKRLNLKLLIPFIYFCLYSRIMMEYNTTRNNLAMREYGRHVQKMIEHLLSIDEPERRQRNAQAVIELMGFLNPHSKNVEDF